MRVTRFDLDTNEDVVLRDELHLTIKAEAHGVVVRIGTDRVGGIDVLTVSADPVGRAGFNRLAVKEVAAHDGQARLVLGAKS